MIKWSKSIWRKASRNLLPRSCFRRRDNYFVPILFPLSSLKNNKYIQSQVRNFNASSNKRSNSNSVFSRKLRDPVNLSNNAKELFKLMLQGDTKYEAIQVGYRQSEDTLGMVYTFDMIDKDGVKEAENRRPPDEFTTIYEDEKNDIDYRCYVHPHALMKVMGATVEANLDTLEFKLLDEEGFLLEP